MNLYQKQDGAMALHWATRYGFMNVVEDLLSVGVDVEALDNWGQSAIVIAAHMNSPQLCSQFVNVLLEAGADVNSNDAGWTALYYAAQKNNHDCYNTIKSAGGFC